MRSAFFIALLIAAVILASGCVSNGRVAFPDSMNASGPGSQPPAVEKVIEISVMNVSADKGLYHSAGVMNLSAVVWSNSRVENAKVRATGINGRMNLEQTVNLSEGENIVSFAYALPRCNVCGGISAGTYVMSCEASYGNLTSSNSTAVQIVQ